MTICICVKVNDGVVFASDSATTVVGAQGQVVTVYNHANKIVNLVKGLGIGMCTWGAASLGGLSIATLAKDLRTKLSNPSDPEFIDPSKFTVSEAAHKVHRYFKLMYDHQFSDPSNRPELGFLLGGYGANQALPEWFRITFPQPDGPTPGGLPPGDPGVSWGGDGEAVSRLVLGFGTSLIPTLLQQQLTETQMIGIVTALRNSGQQLLLYEGMPIQDAIDLGRFLAEIAVKYARFKPGAATIGGPIEVASITKHEGFRWISRKLYFDQAINPDTSHPCLRSQT